MGKTGFEKWAEKGREGARVEIRKPAAREMERGVRTVEPSPVDESNDSVKQKTGRGRPKSKNVLTILNIRIPVEMKDKLERIQEERHRVSLTALIWEILDKYIRDVESGNI